MARISHLREPLSFLLPQATIAIAAHRRMTVLFKTGSVDPKTRAPMADQVLNKGDQLEAMLPANTVAVELYAWREEPEATSRLAYIEKYTILVHAADALMYGAGLMALGAFLAWCWLR